MNNKVSNKLSHAFSLIELLAVIAIIAIISVLTVPGYIRNLRATKVNSMWQLASPAKLAMQSKIIKDNATVSSITVDSGTTEFTTANSDFIKCITIQNGIISVVADPAAFSDKTLWVSWTPTVSSGALTWACNYSSDAAEYMTSTALNCTEGTEAYSSDASCV